MDNKEIKQIKLKGGDKKIMKTKIKQERGITLIALVVTIVVLLILAGVSVNAIFSDSGIIKKAQDAQNKMDEAQQKDLNSINELNNWINEATKEKYVFTLGSNTYEAEEGMTWRQWVNSKYNTIGMKITTKPSKYGISSGHCCIAHTSTDKFANAYIQNAVMTLTTSTEIMTIKGEHTENGNDLFDVLAIVNKRSDSWVNSEQDNITGQLNVVRPDDVINAPGGGYCNATNNPHDVVLSVGDEINGVKNITPQYCTIDAWND